MRAPWHIWLVGFVSLAWNALGAADYVMTQVGYEPYLAQFTEAQRAYFSGFPAWVIGAWALAVWLSIAGSLLLLARSRFAGAGFGLALIFMLVTYLHNFGLSQPRMDQIAGPAALWFSVLIVLVGVGLWLYARAMRKQSVLV